MPKRRLYFFLLCVLVHSAYSKQCGSAPNFVHLGRGERRHLEFWSNEQHHDTDPSLSIESIQNRISSSNLEQSPDQTKNIKEENPEMISDPVQAVQQEESIKPAAESLVNENQNNTMEPMIHEDIVITTNLSIDQTTVPPVAISLINTTEPESGETSNEAAGKVDLKTIDPVTTEDEVTTEIPPFAKLDLGADEETTTEFVEVSNSEGSTEMLELGGVADIKSGHSNLIPQETNEPEEPLSTETPADEETTQFPVVLSEEVVKQDEGIVTTESSIESNDIDGDQISQTTEVIPLDDSGIIIEPDFVTEKSEIASEDQVPQGTDISTGSELDGKSSDEKVTDSTEETTIVTQDQVLQGTEISNDESADTVILSEDSTEPSTESVDQILQDIDLGQKGSTLVEDSTELPLEDQNLQSNEINPSTELEFSLSDEQPTERPVEFLGNQILQGSEITEDVLSTTEGISNDMSGTNTKNEEDQVVPGTEFGSQKVEVVLSEEAFESAPSTEVPIWQETKSGNGTDANSTNEIFLEVSEPDTEEGATEIPDTKHFPENAEEAKLQETVTQTEQLQRNDEQTTMDETTTVSNNNKQQEGADAETPSNEDILSQIKNIISSFSRQDESTASKNNTTRSKFFSLGRIFSRRNKRSSTVDPFFQIQAPDLSKENHQKGLTEEQEELFETFVKESGSHNMEENKEQLKSDSDDGIVNVEVTGVLPFGKSPNKYKGTVDTVVGQIKPRWKRNDLTETNRLKTDLIRYVESRPLPLRRALLLGRSFNDRNSKKFNEETIECDWKIKTDPGLYLLVTFHNLSAPYTLDCQGAYIEVEREANGFEARWCGNKIGQQSGTRSHVIFARSEVRISVFDDGTEGKSWPTGFSADAEVIDLHDAGHYSSFRRSDGYSSVSRLMG